MLCYISLFHFLVGYCSLDDAAVVVVVVAVAVLYVCARVRHECDICPIK